MILHQKLSTLVSALKEKLGHLNSGKPVGGEGVGHTLIDPQPQEPTLATVIPNAGSLIARPFRMITRMIRNLVIGIGIAIMLISIIAIASVAMFGDRPIEKAGQALRQPSSVVGLLATPDTTTGAQPHCSVGKPCGQSCIPKDHVCHIDTTQQVHPVPLPKVSPIISQPITAPLPNIPIVSTASDPSNKEPPNCSIGKPCGQSCIPKDHVCHIDADQAIHHASDTYTVRGYYRANGTYVAPYSRHYTRRNN